MGGVLYTRCNTPPGWAAMVPMRDLLTEHSEVMGAPGQGIVPRIDAAPAFAEELLATDPAAQAAVFAQKRLPILKALQIARNSVDNRGSRRFDVGG